MTDYSDGDMIIVRFTASWCSPCQTIKTTIKSSKGIQDFLKSINAYIVCDVDDTDIILEGQEISKPLEIPQMSKFMYFNFRWNEVSKLVGLKTEREILDWMKKDEKIK